MRMFDKLAMRPKSLKSLYLILSLSKDGAARRVRPPFGRTARGGDSYQIRLMTSLRHPGNAAGVIRDRYRCQRFS